MTATVKVVTLEQVQAFVDRCQAIIDRYMQERFPTLARETLSIDPGHRYYKIVKVAHGQRSVYAFIDSTNGDVLKPATWRAPAKHARGNLFDEKQGMGWMGPYGPAYLR